MMGSDDLLPDESHEFFGPGTDLSISLVAVFMLLIASQPVVDAAKQQDLEPHCEEAIEERTDLRPLAERQRRFANHLANELELSLEGLSDDTLRIPLDPRSCSPSETSECEIVLRHHLSEQRISLGSSVLFAEDRHDVDARSREILTALARVLKQQRASIRRIQIEGHADTQRSNRHRSNLRLSSERAMAVLDVFRSADLDPVETVLSVAAFGQYVPVQRTGDSADFSIDRLRSANDTEEELRLNRRVEVSIIYRWPVAPD